MNDALRRIVPGRQGVGAMLTAVAAAAVFSLLSAPAHAENDGLGVGLDIGDPNGVTLKTTFNERISLDAVIGLGMLDGQHIAGHVDFLWAQPLKELDRAGMFLEFGVGPKVGFFSGTDDVRLGVRGPVGLDFVFREVPIDVFVEIAAGAWLVDSSGFDLDSSAGFRWWFR